MPGKKGAKKADADEGARLPRGSSRATRSRPCEEARPRCNRSSLCRPLAPPSGPLTPSTAPDAPTPEQLAANYAKTCKCAARWEGLGTWPPHPRSPTRRPVLRALGVKPEPEVTKDINDEEREGPYTQVLAGDVDLGPAGVRALVAALLRRPLGGQRLAGKHPYYIATAFRLWRCNAGDDGTLAVVRPRPRAVPPPTPRPVSPLTRPRPSC